jgi:hypothetical protein
MKSLLIGLVYCKKQFPGGTEGGNQTEPLAQGDEMGRVEKLRLTACAVQRTREKVNRERTPEVGRVPLESPAEY